MSHIHGQPDRDLHTEDGEHRATPITTSGRLLAAHEKRLKHHLELHAAEEHIRLTNKEQT